MTSEQLSLSDLKENSEDYRKPYALRRQGVDKPESWAVHPLEELLELEYGNSLPKDDRNEGPYPVFGSNGRSGWHSDYHVEAPGIIVGRKGVNLGIEWSDDNFNVIDTAYFINSDSLKVKDIDLRFLYYHLLDFDLDRLKSGSAVPGLNRNDFYEETVALPPLNEQKKIASILDNIDRKIRTNNRIGNKIEELAHTLFKHQFIDFEPYVDFKDSEIGKIPDSFEMVEVDDLVWSGRGYSYTSEYLDKEDEIEDSYPMINLKNVKEGGGFRTDGYKYYTEESMKDRYLIEEDDLIVAITDLTQEGGLIGSPALIPELDEDKNIISQDVAKIVPEEIPREFLYHLFKTERFQEYAKSVATGTTVLHLSLTSIGEYQFALPPEEEIEKFAQLVRKIHKKKSSIIQENSRLEDLRDTLLPKLISGEVRVNDINLDDLEVGSEV